MKNIFMPKQNNLPINNKHKTVVECLIPKHMIKIVELDGSISSYNPDYYQLEGQTLYLRGEEILEPIKYGVSKIIN